MKKLFALLILSFSFYSSYSQVAVVSKANNRDGTYFNAKQMKNADTTGISLFAVHTAKKDTLFILKCEIGDLTYAIWKQDPKYKGKNPIIIRVNNLSYYQKKYSVQTNTFRN